jgi:hypothetical protein
MNSPPLVFHPYTCHDLGGEVTEVGVTGIFHKENSLNQVAPHFPTHI